ARGRLRDPGPRRAPYERCRQLHARHGRTYYLATLLLPRWKRRHVHALYGFTRYADEIVDELTSTLDGAGQAAALRAWGARFFAGLRGAPCDDPVLPAVLHTVRAFDLDPSDFERFLDSMAMDLHTGGYATYDDLLGYMEGSAAVIGTMMAPILESADPPGAREHARQLGLAFQLTNFIRDLSEDHRRGRVYLPPADLERFGVRRADLAAAVATPAVAEPLAFAGERARPHYAAAEPGIELLAPSSRPCVRVAFELYGGILDEVERAGYPVLGRRGARPSPSWPSRPATGPPPAPRPAPNAASASPLPAPDDPAGRGGPGRGGGRGRRVPALGQGAGPPGRGRGGRGTGPGPRPPAGWYRSRTSGYERIDRFGVERAYPAETVRVVTWRGGCRWRETAPLFTQPAETYHSCGARAA